METHSQNLSGHEIYSSQGQVNTVRVNLPKLQLPTFDGDIQQWPEFWDIFKFSVHERNLTRVSKFSYLKEAVKGAAATAISGIFYYIKLKSRPSVCPHFVVGSISQPWLHGSTSDLLDVIATSSGMTKFIFKSF